MKFTVQTIVLLFLLLVFLSGFVVFLNNGIKSSVIEEKEGMEDKSDNKDCPDLLIRRGNSFLLYNSKAPVIDGVNPLPFYTLDDYINYLEIQRSKGIICPVLFLQQENNTQGVDVFRMRPSPFYVEGGLPPLPMEQNDNSKSVPSLDASRENPPYNQDMYNSFDPTSMYVGKFTNLDEIHQSTMKQGQCSDNQMDPNWCGVMYSQQAVDSGKYKDNEVFKVIYPNMGKPK